MELENLKKRVENLLKKYNLCDTCLGRQFHELYPRSNEKLGRKLREMCGNLGKKGKCYLCNDIFSNIDEIIKKIRKKLENYEFRTFVVGSKFPGELISREEEIWEENGIELCESIKTNFNKTVGTRLKKILRKKIKFENPDIMIIVDLKDNKIDLQISPLYIEGSYKKILPKEKVQRIIENILMKKSKARGVAFYSIGRLEENVVTSCYRPFGIKLKNPIKRRLNLRKVKEEINKSKEIKLGKLKYSTREKILELKRINFNVSYLLTLKLRKKLGKKEMEEIKKKLSKLKTVSQTLKNKIRKNAIKIKKIKFENKKLVIFLEAPKNFSINSFLKDSEPNLQEIINEEFNVSYPYGMKIIDLAKKILIS